MKNCIPDRTVGINEKKSHCRISYDQDIHVLDAAGCFHQNSVRKNGICSNIDFHIPSQKKDYFEHFLSQRLLYIAVYSSNFT